jgi:hypothetical protein
VKYADRAAGDMAFIYWQLWSNRNVTRGMVLANYEVPCGLVVGCHVAPLYWLLVYGLLFKIFYSPPDSNRGPPLWLTFWYCVGYH